MILARFTFFLCALAALFSSSAHAAKDNGCTEYTQPTIIVTPLTGRPHIDTSQNLGSLRAMGQTQDKNRFSSTQHETPVGLTAANLTLNSNYEVITRISPKNNMVCAQIGRFTLNFGFDDTIVYIANELPYNSCSYKTILEHELKHVRVDNLLVRLYTQQFPAMLKKAVKEIGNVRAGSPAMAERIISETMKRYMRELSLNLTAVRQKKQLMIDTKEEYARLNKSCNGNLSKIINRYRH